MLTIVFTVPSLAQDEITIVNVRNAGAFLCEQVIPVLNSPAREIEKTAFLQWTAAYATAASRSNGLIDVFPIGDTDQLVLMVSLVCRENLTVSYETALRGTIDRLQPYWVRQSPEVVSLNDPGGRTVILYEEAIPQVQEDLNRLGYGVSVDGTYGDQTGNAIRQLNERLGSAPWLTPDGQLLYFLTRP